MTLAARIFEAYEERDRKREEEAEKEAKSKLIENCGSCKFCLPVVTPSPIWDYRCEKTDTGTTRYWCCDEWERKEFIYDYD